MAADIRVKLLEQNTNLWNSIITTVTNSLIYIDDSIAEILHWSGKTMDMIDAQAIRIQSIDSGLSGTKDERKAVFITSLLLPGKGIEKLQKIIESSHFQSCTIFSSVTDSDMSLAFKQTGGVENESFYCKLKETVLFWMNHKDKCVVTLLVHLSQPTQPSFTVHATVEIHHIPCVYANIAPGVFFMPAFSTIFPMLPSDLPTIREWLKTKGDQRKFTSLADVEIQHTPKVFQVRLKLLASALSAMFDELEVAEDCYGIGHTSKLLAAELVNISSARMKKNVGSRCTVIFIDRTLDMVRASSRSGSNLADKIFELLPKLPGHNLDVAVDMTRILSSANCENDMLVPGSLAHAASHKVAQNLLASIILETKQESLTKIYMTLVKILKDESISTPEVNDVGKVTTEKLSSLMDYFRNNMKIFLKHSAVLQVAMAVVNMAEHANNSGLEEIESTQKVLQLSLNEEDSPSCLSHILMLLKNVREGIRSYYLEDILLLLVYVYSLVGDESSDSLQEENKVQDTVIKDVLSGSLKVKTNFIIDMKQDSEKVVRNKIFGCFQRISGLKSLRDDFTSFRELFTNASTRHNLRSYQPILKQIVENVFDPKKTEINDIEFKSGRLKDFIKSGFSLFMNVSKPHPSDHPILFLFVVGGVTCAEIQQVNEYTSSKNIKTQVIIGSTKIVNSEDILKRLFWQNNTLYMPYS